METLFLNYMNSVHLSKWHYLLIFYIYLIVYVSFYFLFFKSYNAVPINESRYLSKSSFVVFNIS